VGGQRWPGPLSTTPARVTAFIALIWLREAARPSLGGWGRKRPGRKGTPFGGAYKVSTSLTRFGSRLIEKKTRGSRQPLIAGPIRRRTSTTITWTKEGVRSTLAPEKAKTVIARNLKRSVDVTHQKAMRLGVTRGSKEENGAKAARR
jgi:hypothetical protein